MANNELTINDVEMVEVKPKTTSPTPKAKEAQVIADVANGMEGGLIGNLFRIAYLDDMGKFHSFIEEYSQHYFAAILFFKSVGFFAKLYRYIKNSRTNNAADHANLGYDIVNFGLVSAAIGGALFATVTFALITPVLFVIALGLDTLKNLGLLAFNLFRTLQLSFQFRKSKINLDDPENAYLKHRYNELKKDYSQAIERSTKGFIISFLATIAAAAIFLFPHVSVGATAISAAVVTVSALGVKTTVAGVLGAFAFAAPLAVLAGDGLRWLKSKLFKPKTNAELIQDADERKPLIPSASSEEVLERVQKRDIQWKTNFNHHGFFHERAHRTFFVIHSDSEQTATEGLIKATEAKMNEIKNQMTNASWVWDKMQHETRMQKYNALGLTLKFLQAKSEERLAEFGATHRSIDNTPMTTITALLRYIYKAYPKVDSSAFRNVSDTRDLLKAVKALESYNTDEVQEIRRKTLVA